MRFIQLTFSIQHILFQFKMLHVIRTISRGFTKTSASPLPPLFRHMTFHCISLAKFTPPIVIVDHYFVRFYYYRNVRPDMTEKLLTGTLSLNTNKYYRNDPEFSDRYAWSNSADPDQTALRVFTVCHSVCMVWTHYFMVEPHSSNFRVITATCLGVRIFRKFTVCTLLNIPSKKISHYHTILLITNIDTILYSILNAKNWCVSFGG